MKIKHLLLLMLTGFFVIACSDDDNETTSNATQIEGTYTGKAEVAISNVSYGKFTAKQIKIERLSDDMVTVNLTLNYDGITSVKTEATITYSDGKYILAGEEITEGIYKTKLINGTITSKSEYNFTFQITSGAMLMPILVTVDSNDDGADEPRDASAIVGTYTGSASLEISGAPYGDVLTGRNIELKQLRTDSVGITFMLEGGSGSMVIEKVEAGATVTPTKDGYKLEGEEVITGIYKTTVTGTITDDKEVNLTFEIIPGSMPMPIVVNYTAAADFQRVKATVTIDATDYMKWTYFSFKKGKLTTYSIADKDAGGMLDADDSPLDEESFNWDLAIHRYDFRTNEASAVNTQETDFEKVTTIPTGDYIADSEGQVISDVSNMMISGPTYAPFNINTVLNTWITSNTTVMPPEYTIHKYVYVVKCKDGKYAKIQVTDRTNDEDVSGHITFTYEYPFAEAE